MLILVVTTVALFLIVIVSAAMILLKIRSEMRAEQLQHNQQAVQNSLTLYLLSDIQNIHQFENTEQYEKGLEPLVRQLVSRSLPKSFFGSTTRRAALRSTMLDISKNLFGETQLRLTYAFQVLGFVDEEIKAAQSKKWWIRARACHNLSVMQARKGEEVLAKNLDDEYEDVRIEAAQSLLDIVGLASLTPILMTIKDISGWMQVRLSRSILSFGGDAVPHLVAGMQSESHRVKKFCIDMLGRLGDVQAVPTLIEYMNYSVPEVQLASVEAFGRIGDARAIPLVLNFLRSRKEKVRIIAAHALGNLGSPATVDALNRLLLHDTIEVRLAAAEALSRIGEAGIKTLKYSTQSNNEEAKLVALQYLHEQNIALSGNS